MFKGKTYQFEQELITSAKARWSGGRMTLIADKLHPITGLIFSPLVIVAPVSTFILSLLATFTFGLSQIVLSGIWWIPLGILYLSSLLWLKYSWIRPILVLPGVFFSEFSGAYAACMPEMGEWEARATKQALCYSWPRSVLIYGMLKGLISSS